MSTYCIGDIHGRYELFKALLKKIDFNPQNDHLYFLGDVIDHHYGGIKILKFIVDNEGSCTLIKGNHEEHFIDNKDAYDMIMLDNNLKEIFKCVVENYSPLFESISDTFIKKLKTKDKNAIYETPRIKKWVNSGRQSVRKRVLDNMFLLAEAMDFDKSKIEKAFLIIADFDSSFKTKAFVKELLEQNTVTYQQIINLCENADAKLNLNVQEKSFVLSHISQDCFDTVNRMLWFPHGNTKDTYYIFGHLPIPVLHKKIRSYFTFDYKEALSIVDKNGNFYYNLDLGSCKTNPQVVLRLDDLSEFYVSENNDDSPKDKIVRELTRNYKFENEISDGSIHTYIETFIGNSHEYLIGAHTKEKCIVYYRADMLDLRMLPWRKKPFEINEWYNGHSIEQIIEKVDSDFRIQMDNPENIGYYEYLCGKSLTAKRQN